MKRLGLGFNLKTVILATLLPLFGAGLFIVFAAVQGIPALRYDPAYFTSDYAARFDSPRAVIAELDVAFKTGDRELAAELQGLRRPRNLPHNPRFFGAMLWERTGDYAGYMYWDSDTWERHMVQTLEVGDRWVLAPEDASFFLRTGLWLRTWLPIAVVYWIAEVVALIVIALAARGRRWGRQWYGLEKP